MTIFWSAKFQAIESDAVIFDIFNYKNHTSVSIAIFEVIWLLFCSC